MVVEIDVADGEAEQIVDFLLRQHPLAAVLVLPKSRLPSSTMAAHCSAMVSGEFIGGSRFRGLRGILGIERGLPLGGNCVLVDLVVARHDSSDPSRH